MATDERVTEHNVQSEGLGGNAADKKKASKFQPFKKFFGRRKKREATPDRDDTKLKPSSSFGNVCNGVLSSDEETNDGLRSSSYGMGTRAFSHDSIFIPDGRAESEESVQAMSQENILGKVKTLQQQLAKNIKFGQPPQMTVSVKAIGEANASFEADVLLTSPMETETQQDAVLPETCNQAGDIPDSLSPVSLPGTRHEAEEKVTPVKSSRPKRHHSPSGTIETVNLDAIPLAIARLDNSAAKHKLSVKPKNQRVSKKHRRLSKELQSMIVSEFEHEIPELQRYEVSKHDGPHTADKPSQHREGQEDKTEGQIKQEDHWRNLETEKKVQMAEAEVKNHLEHKRLQEFGESQREQEGKKQKLQVEEPFLKMEERKSQEEKKRREDQRHQELLEPRHKGLEEQRRKEGGLPEWEVQKPQAEEKHQELEEGKQSEEDRGQDVEVLKEEKPQEEQRHRGQEAQRHQEEQSRWNVDMQRQQEREWQQVDHRRVLEEQKQQELEDQRRKEEKGFRELERKQQLEKLLQQKGDKRHEQEKTHLQETKLGQQEGQRGQELEEGTHETGKQEELNQQTVYGLKRQTEQRQEVQKNRNPESEETLQEKKSAVKLEEPKRPEGRRQHLEEAPKRKDGQEQEEPQKTVRSAELGEGEPAELRQPWAQKRVLHAELMERERGRKSDGHKTSGLEGQHPLGQAKEQDKSFQLPLDKNTRSEEKCSQRFEKELPLKEETRMQEIQQLDKGQKEEEPLSHNPRKGTEVQEQERILGEELRWQEVDARQTMPRGFTFQVSSGEKQIIFHKVNLSPVTPVKEAQTPSATKEVKSSKPSQGSHAVPSSLCVPHTAILVTGAQLCGTAVNLNQIKDTACKSFLGLTEERKTVDIPAAENTQKMSPDAKSSSGKTNQPQDSLGNQAILAEWASIRSKILKSAESGKLNEKDKGSLSRHSDDWAPKGRGASHSQLRKTLSANAKFSITPAWQKFSEISKANIDLESTVAPEAENKGKQMGPLPSQEAVQPPEALTRTANVFGTPAGKTEVHHKVADNSEGCKFAKDLPSFLVPAAPHSLSKETPQTESPVAMGAQQSVGMRKLDRMSPSGEENVSPFGVKLRRTNYSVRFHYDQQAEQKKKKRYSAGDSFDGVPSPLVTPTNEKDANNIFLKESKSPRQERKDTIVISVKDSSATVSHIQATAAPLPVATSGQVSPVSSKEKSVGKSPLPQKPALAPKPVSQTPPSSPLSKMRRSHLMEPVGQKGAKMEPDTSWRKTEPKENSLLSQVQDASKNDEEECKEKKSFFPSITMPWKEKVEKKPETLKKERPVLQSRHSIDGSKLMDKVESAQPLWITLALQKQKGFREQQATREERRQAREAKQAEKLAKENASTNSQTDNKSSHTSRTSAMLKPTVQEEEKKVETATSRLERREQLKKSNTLPTSVTVEISDSIPTSPLAKEVTKRFSTPDTNPVSTEPAWLALAKRKAKAWSDCPQIIK